jgi:hypothetical protein
VTSSTEEQINVAAVAKLAPAGKPSARRTWIAPVPEIAAMLRAYPGDPNYPDSDPRSGWRLIGHGAKHQAPKLSQDRMRIIRGDLAPFADTQGGVFEASVSTDPHAPGRKYPAELWARWLDPHGAKVAAAGRAAIYSHAGRAVPAVDAPFAAGRPPFSDEAVTGLPS